MHVVIHPCITDITRGNKPSLCNAFHSFRDFAKTCPYFILRSFSQGWTKSTFSTHFLHFIASTGVLAFMWYCERERKWHRTEEMYLRTLYSSPNTGMNKSRTRRGTDQEQMMEEGIRKLCIKIKDCDGQKMYRVKRADWRLSKRWQ